MTCEELTWHFDSKAAEVQVKALEKKASKQAALQQALKDALTTCLVNPFVESATQGRTRTCAALTQSWLAYLEHMQVLHIS